MALAASYKQFLAAPDASLLASDASLHYVTTTTSFRGAADIIKHIKSLAGKLKKTKEEFLHPVQGQDALAVEVDTTLEFLISSGPYLPGLDDNFLADRTVYLPITHFVSFDSQGKITQIRQAWDQGSLLKQVDVIGRTGRNWPIRDSKEQIKLIETCVKTASHGVATQQDPTNVPVRPRGDSNNVSRDPNSSLSLFGSREESDQTIASVISPKGGVRPRQRSFAEILGDEPIEDPDSPSAGRRSESPSKVVAPKAGAGKKFQPSRLFDTDKDEGEKSPPPGDVKSPERHYRPHPTKYNHFDFADGSDPHDTPRPGDPTFKKTKHSNQWDFEDFVTPAKPKPSKTIRAQEVRHWGTEDDEVFDSPERKPVPPKARRDAEPHFEFIDDGEPKGEPRASRPRGATHNTGLGLYKNNLYDEEGDESTPTADSRALGVITNAQERGRDFEPHFSMTDESPAQPQQSRPVAQDRKKAVKMMDANWSSYDVSPSQKENQRSVAKNGSKTGEDRGIHISGDGMGGGRGSNRDWLFGAGDSDDNSQAVKPNNRRKPAAKSGDFSWDF